jgi:hypothetical protein
MDYRQRKKVCCLWSVVCGLAIIGFLAAGCVGHEPRQQPPTEILRKAGTPLVIAIPGLNVPLIAPQDMHFADLEKKLDEEEIPSIIVLYDSKQDPIRNAADLSSDKHSIAILRVMPRIATAISQENQIRKSQGLGSLKQLILVTYSQGGVLAWDILRRFADFEEELFSLKEAAGEEWERFKNDPEFEAFNDANMNFFLIHNVRYQEPETFKQYVDLQNIYYRALRNLEKAVDRIKARLRPAKGESPYPKIVGWITKHYPVPSETRLEEQDLLELLTRNFFIKYSIFQYLEPLDIKMFSITGSLFGSPTAFAGYFYSEYFPWIADIFVKNRADQIKDTRLGSHHHLVWVKSLFKRREFEGADQRLEDGYFIVGVNGWFDQKGDGLVDQSAAHPSQHRLSEVPYADIVKGLESAQQVEVDWGKLPEFPVTGLPVRHLPEHIMFFDKPGAAQMTKDSKVYPFLLSFVKGDTDSLEVLHKEHHDRLRQFMVSVYLTGVDELSRGSLDLKAVSKGVKITGRYENPTANSVTWTGHFKKDTEGEGAAVLTLSKDRKKTTIEFPLYPGKNHFIDIVGEKLRAES